MNPLMFLLKRNKKFKRIKGIITLIIIIIILVMLIVGAIFLLDILEITDLDEDSGASNYGGTSSSGSASIDSLLASCKKIDEYMADNGYYYSLTASFNEKYNEGSSKATCCATYVSWCLQDVNMISSHTNYAGDIYDMLKSNSDWEEVNASDMSDLQPGDVGVYYDSGKSPPYYHTNIYSGDSLFWDAGSDEKVKNKGPKSHNVPTYVFRYKK